MNRIKIDLDRKLAPLDRNVFGGFAEHLGRHIYGGIYDPDSPLADEDGFRTDVIEAVRDLRMPVIRYPGGNFASQYHWRDGIGPRNRRPTRLDLAWAREREPNTFGTDEFVDWCRKVGTEPMLVVNCGDGTLREARQWVEYCNTPSGTALADLRAANGHPEPHNVMYWGVGNEVEGGWQIGKKTAEQYARTFAEYGKAMKRVDPGIKLMACGGASDWKTPWVDYGKLLLEQTAKRIDTIGIHVYVGNPEDDFARFMTVVDDFGDRLTGYEGLLAAMRAEQKIDRPIHMAVDEWNVMYRTNGHDDGHEEVYNLEDALVVAQFLNLFIRHARAVRMANLAQVVNVIAPIITRPDGLLKQTIFHPFATISRLAGPEALDVWWEGETFQGGERTGVRVLDVSATLDPQRRQLALFIVNRSATTDAKTEIRLPDGRLAGPARVTTITGPDVKATNTWDTPERVAPTETETEVDGNTWTVAFPPASVTAIICGVA